MTKPEVLLWENIKGKHINGYKFRRQYSINNFIVDFYCTELKLAIEVDGSGHFLTDDKVAYDKNRQAEIEKFGITFYRVLAQDVEKNIRGVITELYNRIDIMKK